MSKVIFWNPDKSLSKLLVEPGEFFAPLRREAAPEAFTLETVKPKARKSYVRKRKKKLEPKPARSLFRGIGNWM